MPSLPTQIGPYRVLRQLGAGGMGVVLEAIHDKIERRVAIKLLLPEYAKNTVITERLFGEALAVNRIDHPGLIQIYDYGQLPDGAVYLVMEYLRGQTLEQWLEQNPGPVPPQMVIKIAAQVTSALAAAHSKQIVHRDLKPDNLMLVEDSAESGAVRVKILDFGIAKVAQDAPKAKTATDLVMGTPYYMSPEQCQGAGFVDAKSDVYSLGVMLFKLLADQFPFDAPGSGELIGMHLFKSPPLLREVAPAVPGGLAALVQGLLAKSRDARPTMDELRGEFEQMVRAGATAPSQALIARLRVQMDAAPLPRGAATTLGGSNGQSLLGERTRRHKLVAIGAVLVLLPICLALLGVTRERSHSGSRADRPVASTGEPARDQGADFAPTANPSATPGRDSSRNTSAPLGATGAGISDQKLQVKPKVEPRPKLPAPRVPNRPKVPEPVRRSFPLEE